MRSTLLLRLSSSNALPLLSKRFLFSSIAGLSKREFANLEERIYQSCSAVVDPILQQDLATLQWLHRRMSISQDGSRLQILLRIPSLLHPLLSTLKDQVRTAAEEELKNSYDPINIIVEAMATKPVPFMARINDNHEEALANLGPGLASVAHIVSVYSCKGGVGKSTVAVNLAYQLAHMGGRVGLLDLDVYGPSLSVLVRPSDTTVRRSPLGAGMVIPINHENVKMLSLSFVGVNSGVPGSGQDNGAAVMRGPMAGKVVSQLLKGTDWGDLDVLILDLPPGTGDVQLQALQDVQLSGAVAVSTPSKLAAVDTRKGIEMFTSLGVPTLALVENMAYFECDGGKIHYPFGKGLLDLLGDCSTVLDSRSVVQFPISPEATESTDFGKPFCLTRTHSALKELKAFEDLSNLVCESLLKLQYRPSDTAEHVTFGTSLDEFSISTLQLTYDKSNDALTVRLYADSGAIQRRVTSAQLRCRDPQSGNVIDESPFRDLASNDEELQQPASNPIVTSYKANTPTKSPSLIVNRVEKKGRYGYAIYYADGNIIIYSMKSLAMAAGGILKRGE